MALWTGSYGIAEEKRNQAFAAFIEERIMDKTGGDYGWLDPRGRFYEAAWGEHQTWAQEHIKEMPLWDELSLKERIWAGGMGDVLMNHGWVLLHSPSCGTAFPTRKPDGRYTKAQADFLYQYYIERDEREKANEIMNEYGS